MHQKIHDEITEIFKPKIDQIILSFFEHLNKILSIQPRV
jgi:hypothetical protein